MTPRGKALALFVLFAALVGLETCRLENPDAAPEDAAPEAFSATRALTALRAISVDAPHAVGMAAHDAVRDRLAAALRGLDYVVEIQHAFACNAAAMCGTVDNVIARRADAPVGRKAVVAFAGESDPARVRALLEDGPSGGPYQRPEEDTRRVWDAAVELLRERLEWRETDDL